MHSKESSNEGMKSDESDFSCSNGLAMVVRMRESVEKNFEVSIWKVRLDKKSNHLNPFSIVFFCSSFLDVFSFEDISVSNEDNILYK